MSASKRSFGFGSKPLVDCSRNSWRWPIGIALTFWRWPRNQPGWHRSLPWSRWRGGGWLCHQPWRSSSSQASPPLHRRYSPCSSPWQRVVSPHFRLFFTLRGTRNEEHKVQLRVGLWAGKWLRMRLISSVILLVYWRINERKWWEIQFLVVFRSGFGSVRV